MENETGKSQLRSFWRPFFKFNWKFGLVLLIVICVPRFFLVLKANYSGSYGAIGLIMLFSAIAPFIFLNKGGRREMGLVSPANYRWI